MADNEMLPVLQRAAIRMLRNSQNPWLARYVLLVSLQNTMTSDDKKRDFSVP